MTKQQQGQARAGGATAQRPARIYPALLFLLGLVLAIGGGQLAGLGGSWYYLVTGVALLASSMLVWRGNALGGWLYALMLAWTLVWSLAEVGLDFWTLLPRLALLFVLGLWLLTPLYRRTVVRGPISAQGGKAAAGALAVAMAAVVVVGLAKGDKHETKAAQALPEIQQTVAGDAPRTSGTTTATTRAASAFRRWSS